MWGKEAELSSPGRGAVAIAPRRAARPDADDAAGLRRVARRPLPVNAAGARHPNLTVSFISQDCLKFELAPWTY